MTLRRLEEFANRPGQPGWIRRTESAGGRPVKPVLRCQCGHVLGLAEYSVDAKGLVSPAFEHTEMTDRFFGLHCGWRAELQLADYRDGDFPATMPKAAS